MAALGSVEEQSNFSTVFNQSSSDYEQDGCDFATILTSDGDTSRFLYSQGESIYTKVFLPIILIVGVLDNAAFIYVVLRIPRMHTVTNCYLVGLSFADIVFLVFAIGSKLWCFALSPISGDDTPLGLSGCQVTQFMVNTSYFVSLCFITLVSWERYNGVCRPHMRKDTGAKVMAKITISTLVSSILAASLLVSFWTTITQCIVWPATAKYSLFKDKRLICTYEMFWADKYTYTVQTFPFFFSLLINVLFYYKIIRGLNQSIRRTHHSTNRKDSSTRNQVAMMLVINGVALFALLAPFEAMSLFNLIAICRGYQYYLPLHHRVWLAYVGRVASYVNSIINPIIYTVLSTRYREAFVNALLPARWRPQSKYTGNLTPGSTGRSGTMTTKVHESRM